MTTRSRLGDLVLEVLPPGPPRRAMTVDVEDWYHSNFASAPRLDESALPRRVVEGVERLLDLLDPLDVKATFFVLGVVAREHPTLATRIANAGHEVASHGDSHDLVYASPPEVFARTVREARERLCDQSGQDVAGFRAPSWSITERCLWAFDALAEAGFRYDSSVFPAANYLYGIDGAPHTPYRVHTPRSASLLELPPPILSAGPLRIGVGGGLYLRALPLWVQRFALKRYARWGAPFLTYLHPREIDPHAAELRLPLSRFEQLLHRVGLRSVSRKIEALLREDGWEPLGAIAARLDGVGSSDRGDGVSWPAPQSK
ncbi:MAG: polysaccharide deacetylase family protein [Myxococcota bacterium]